MPGNLFTAQGRALVSRVSFQGELKASISQAVEALGGFARLVRPGESILVKPNFNTADPPPASSDPQFVRALIELLYEHGAGKVLVGESSMFTLSTRAILEKSGMLQAAREAGAEVIVFDDDSWLRRQVKGRYLKGVSLPRSLLQATKVVYAACLKTHRYAGFTISLKLAVAFMKPRERVWLHLRHLEEKIAELNTLVHPHLILVDARKCFVSGGPSQGLVREPGLILASGDRLAIDREGIRILQSYPECSLTGDPWQLPQMRRAVELGLGVRGEEDYQVLEPRPSLSLAERP